MQLHYKQLLWHYLQEMEFEIYHDRSKKYVDLIKYKFNEPFGLLDADLTC